MELIVLIAVLAVLGLAAAVLVAGRRSGPAAPPGPARLADRLGRTREAVASGLATLVVRRSPDDEFWEGVEETLLAADVGPSAASEAVERARARRPEDPQAAMGALRDELAGAFLPGARELATAGAPSVVLVVGVNGVGKTTTAGKLAWRLRQEGRRPLLGCADTFRAAAAEQLQAWGERVGADVVTGLPGGDPASVAFDAYQAARSRGRDVVVVDTGGRLQSKRNLMEELAKVARVLRREAGELDEVLLVLDATLGQNALAQAREFTEAVGVTGIVLTKLDGTARGGVVVAVERELGIPVKLVGVGEDLEDLVPFRPEEFVDALLAVPA